MGHPSPLPDLLEKRENRREEERERGKKEERRRRGRRKEEEERGRKAIVDSTPTSLWPDQCSAHLHLSIALQIHIGMTLSPNCLAQSGIPPPGGNAAT